MRRRTASLLSSRAMARGNGTSHTSGTVRYSKHEPFNVPATALGSVYTVLAVVGVLMGVAIVLGIVCFFRKVRMVAAVVVAVALGTAWWICA